MSQTKAQLIDPVDGTIVNADINASAAIAGTKISPDFGSQNIVTTGDLTVSGGDVTINGTTCLLNFNDTNNDPDFRIQVESGNFLIEDATNSYADRFVISASGNIGINNNNPQTSLDVTGAITATGDISMADKLVHSGDTDTSIRFPAANTIALETAGNESFRVDPSRRLLINCTSQRLIAGGSPRVLIENTTTEQLALVRTSADNGGPILALGKTRSGATVQDDDSLGSISWCGDDGSDLQEVGSRIEVKCDSATAANRVPARMEFYTENAASALNLNMVITRDSQVFLPAGDTRDNMQSYCHSTADDFAFGKPSASADTGMTIIGNPSYSSFINFSDGSSGTRQGSILYQHGSGADTMFFRTNNNQNALVIDSSQQVGIGTTSPSRRLNLNIGGDQTWFEINKTRAAGEAMLQLVHSAGNRPAAIRYANADDAWKVGITGEEAFTFANGATNTGDGTERARFSSDGKFMMGTTGSLDMGFGPQVLSTRGGNAVGFDGTAAAIFGQLDNDAATCIFYNAASDNQTNMLDTRCARGAQAAYSFAIYRSNGAGDTEFRLRGDGNAYADGSWNGGGADYAEYFEWSDGNSSDEDRRGYTVVLDGNKIRKSTSSDSAATIIGVISGNPSIVGDNDIDNWKQKYQKDDYGSYVLDSDGERILNSDWDETKEYVSREDRKEWSIVGLMGKIRIRKGQTMGTNWIKMQDISATVEEWLVR